MDIKRALIEDIYGCAVVPGRLALTGETPLSSDLLPQHDHLRLANWSSGLHLSIVTNIEPLENGFCRIERGGFGIYLRGLTARDIDARMMGSVINLKKTEKDSASLQGVRNFKPQSFSRIEISGAYVPAGLQLLITGGDVAGDAPFCDEFRIEVLLPWETMNLMGWRWSAAAPPDKRDPEEPHHKAKDDSPHRRRDPKKLQDLLILEHLSWPVIPGSFSLLPPDQPSPRSFQPAREAKPFVELRTDHRENDINIVEIFGVEVLDSGFARTNTGDTSMSLTIFGRNWLEEGLTSKSSVSATASGDMLGSAAYRTGGDEPWSTRAFTKLSVNQIDIRAALDADGLALTARGQFAPLDREKSQEIQANGFLPKTAFDLSISLPWALLVLRQFSFARRVSEF